MHKCFFSRASKRAIFLGFFNRKKQCIKNILWQIVRLYATTLENIEVFGIFLKKKEQIVKKSVHTGIVTVMYIKLTRNNKIRSERFGIAKIRDFIADFVAKQAIWVSILPFGKKNQSKSHSQSKLYIFWLSHVISS